MMRSKLAGLVRLSCILALPCAVAARADDSTVTDEILDILRRRNEISEERYEELKEKAEKEQAQNLRLFWKDGLRLESRDGDLRFKLGGRINNDWGLIEADGLEDDFGRTPGPEGIPANRTEDLDDLETGTEFRRARLSFEGTLYSIVPFKLEFDFAGGDADFKDVWIGFTKLPGFDIVKVGHFKEPFSLEELTSSRHITFMERGLPNLFVPSRNTGLGLQRSDFEERMTWAIGAFRDADGFGDGFGGDSIYNLTTRLTGLPWYADGGRKLLHLGVSYSHQFRKDDPLRYRSEPETHLSPVEFIDTRLAVLSGGAETTVDLVTDGVDLVNPEIALVLGPLSLQCESVHSFVEAPGRDDPRFYGVYVFASYFLTGEHRAYKTKKAAFDRVHPNRNFLGSDGGWGAWEIAARFSRADLEDAGVRGGALDDVTLGLNWYLNPNVKIMFNYVHADRNDLGTANLVQGRFQIEL